MTAGLLYGGWGCAGRPGGLGGGREGDLCDRRGGAGAWSACCAPHTLESSSLLPWPCRARTSNSHPAPPAPLLAEPPHQAKTFACALTELINTDISANSLQPGGEAPLAAQQQWHSPLWAVWLDVPLNCWGLLCPSCLYADSVTRLDGRCAREGENACVQRVVYAAHPTQAPGSPPACPTPRARDPRRRRYAAWCPPCFAHCCASSILACAREWDAAAPLRHIAERVRGQGVLRSRREPHVPAGPLLFFPGTTAGLCSCALVPALSLLFTATPLPRTPPAVIGADTRRQMRETFQLPQAPCNDYIVHCLCCWCAICQEAREIKVRPWRRAGPWRREDWRRAGVCVGAPACRGAGFLVPSPSTGIQ